MAVSVLNTDAGLSSKTLDLLESDQTITGNKTFSRSTNAPFAVNAGAAVVANLDADKVDGLEAAAFVLKAGDTMTGDLKFTDALYDIGKSGATRPRDIFMSRNGVIGGTLVVTGIVTFTADVLTVAFTDYTSSSTVVGWAATPSPYFIFYKKIGKRVFVNYHIEGTSNSVTTSFTLPHASANNGFTTYGSVGYALNNSVEEAGGYSSLPPNSSTVTFARTAGGTWTGSNLKRIGGQFNYEAAS